MKKINNFDTLQTISGGDNISDFCTGFAAAYSVYQLGVYANLWNPAGQTALAVAGGVGIGCAFYEFF